MKEHRKKIAEKAKKENPQAFVGLNDEQIETLVDRLSIATLDADSANRIWGQYGSGAGPAIAVITNAIREEAKNKVFVDSYGNAVQMFTNNIVGRGGTVFNADFYNNPRVYAEELPMTASGISEFSNRFGYAPPLSLEQIESLDTEAKKAMGAAVSRQHLFDQGGPVGSVIKIIQAIGVSGAPGSSGRSANIKRAPSGTGQSSAQGAGQKKPDTNVVSSGNTSTNTGNANTNAGAVNKAGGAATSAGSINSSTSFVDSLLKPNGQFVGRVEGGATPNIRTVSNQDFSTLQSQLLTGAKPVGQYSGGKGTWYELPSGGRVGVRRSDDFGLTLDINIPGYPSGFKVHQK